MKWRTPDPSGSVGFFPIIGTKRKEDLIIRMPLTASAKRNKMLSALPPNFKEPPA